MFHFGETVHSAQCTAWHSMMTLRVAPRSYYVHILQFNLVNAKTKQRGTNNQDFLLHALAFARSVSSVQLSFRVSYHSIAKSLMSYRPVVHTWSCSGLHPHCRLITRDIERPSRLSSRYPTILMVHFTNCSYLLDSIQSCLENAKILADSLDKFRFLQLLLGLFQCWSRRITRIFKFVSAESFVVDEEQAFMKRQEEN